MNKAFGLSNEISHICLGSCVGHISTSGDRLRSVPHCERKTLSASLFSSEPGCETLPTVNEKYCQLFCWALFVMLCCKVRRTSFLTMFISLVDLDVNVLMTYTTPMLSIWKIMRLFDNHVCHNRSETYTGNSSKNVMSRITSEKTQWVGHFE